MSEPLFFADVLPQRVWPHDSRYMGRCGNCGNAYFGPKRAPSCWLCAPEGTREWWLGNHAET